MTEQQCNSATVTTTRTKGSIDDRSGEFLTYVPFPKGLYISCCKLPSSSNFRCQHTTNSTEFDNVLCKWKLPKYSELSSDAPVLSSGILHLVRYERFIRTSISGESNNLRNLDERSTLRVNCFIYIHNAIIYILDRWH